MRSEQEIREELNRLKKFLSEPCSFGEAVALDGKVRLLEWVLGLREGTR